MSCFKTIFAIIVCFYSSLSLGMESTEFKYSNPYFDEKLQKPLLLLMAKNKDPQAINLDKDVILVIAAKNYDLYCEELFKSKIGEQSFEEHWQHKLSGYYNSDNRLRTCGGKKIEINDFHFTTLNPKGREKFRWALENATILRHPPFTMKYDKILQLPVPLRSKIGDFCVVQSVIKKGLFAMSLKDWITGDFFVIDTKPLVPEKYYDAIKHQKKIEKRKMIAHKLITQE